MRLWPSALSRSPKADHPHESPPPKPPSIVGMNAMNKASALCIDISAYHDRYTEILGPLSLESRTRSSSVSSPTTLHSPSPSLLDPPLSRSSTLREGDNARTTRSRDIGNPSSGGGHSPSLQSFNNTSGDAPAFPHIQRDAYDVTSVESAVKLVQRVTSHHEVDSFVLGVRIWLKGLSRLNSANAAASIRTAAIEHFLHIWQPPSENPIEGPIERLLTFSDDIDTGLAVARLLGMLFRAQVFGSTDIAFAAELLFKNRYQAGSLRAMHELIRASEMRTCRSAALGRMVVLADGLKAMKNELGCPNEMRFYASEIIRLIDHFKSMLAFRALPPVNSRGDSRVMRLDSV